MSSSNLVWISNGTATRKLRDYNPVLGETVMLHCKVQRMLCRSSGKSLSVWNDKYNKSPIGMFTKRFESYLVNNPKDLNYEAMAKKLDISVTTVRRVLRNTSIPIEQ